MSHTSVLPKAAFCVVLTPPNKRTRTISSYLSWGPISPIAQGKSSKPAWENLSEPQHDRKVKVPQRSHTKLGHCSCTYDDGTSLPKETYHRVVLEDGTTNIKKTTWDVQAWRNIWVSRWKNVDSKLLSTYIIYIHQCGFVSTTSGIVVNICIFTDVYWLNVNVDLFGSFSLRSNVIQ